MDTAELHVLFTDLEFKLSSTTKVSFLSIKLFVTEKKSKRQ